ncbi:MAG: endonuclease III [bacterium]
MQEFVLSGRSFTDVDFLPMVTRKKTTKKKSAATKRGCARGNEDRTLLSRVKKIVSILKREYPEIKCPLDYSTSLELLIASILSAQCTDVRVNMVTPKIFAKYRTTRAWADAEQSVLEEEIRSTGFFRNKAKAIRACCSELVERFGGEVPDSIEELASLPGVGRKTANVVIGYIFGKSAIVVDTHCKRVSARLGLTAEKNPDKIEQDLIRLVPTPERTGFSHRIVQHGRRVCQARKPRCATCSLFSLCPFPAKQPL